MKRRFRRIVSFILTVALVISSVRYTPEVVNAADDYSGLEFTNVSVSMDGVYAYYVKENTIGAASPDFHGNYFMKLAYSAVNKAEDMTITINGINKTVEDPEVHECAQGMTTFYVSALANDAYHEITITSENGTATIIVKKGNPDGAPPSDFEEGENILKNSNFDGLNFWEAYKNEGTDMLGEITNNGNGSVTVPVVSYTENQNKKNYDTQFKQAGISLNGDKWYKAQITVTASVDRTVQLLIQKNGDPYTVYSDSIVNVKAGESITIEAIFTKVDDANVLLGVMMGQFGNAASEAGSVTISNVRLEVYSKDPSKQFFTLEAEAAVKNGNARTTASANCSNGYYVENIGKDGGSITYTVNAQTAGERKIKVYYMTGDAGRFHDVVVNNGTSVKAAAPISLGWSTPTTEPTEITVNLNEGDNTIWLGRLDGWGPNIDKIEIELTEKEAAATVVSMINTLPETVTTNDKAQVLGIYAAYINLTNKSAVTNYSKLQTALDICGLEITRLEPLKNAYIYNLSEIYGGSNVYAPRFEDPNLDRVNSMLRENEEYTYQVGFNGYIYTLGNGVAYDFSTLGMTPGTEYQVTMYAVYKKADGTEVRSEASEPTWFTYAPDTTADYDNGIKQIHIYTSESQKLHNSNFNIYTDTEKEKVQAFITAKYENGETIAAYDYGTVNVRGNSTSLTQKKAYNIKFDSKQNLFGLGGTNTKGAKKWSLLANIFDKTLLRNEIAMQFQRELEGEQSSFLDGASKVFTSQCETVDLYMDGKYMGTYTLIESVEVDETRVNIDTSYVEEDTDKVVGTDGVKTVEINGTTYTTYDILLELANDTYETNSRFDDEAYYFDTELERFAINEPERTSDDYSHLPNEGDKPEFVTKTKEFIQGFEDALQTGDYNLFEKYIDVDSFVDFYITTEYFMVKDINFSSTRFYIRGGKIYAGPLWDIDLSSGNIINGETYVGFRTREQFEWFGLLMSNPRFYELVRERYSQLHNEGRIQELYRDGGVVDSKANTIAASAQKNYENAYNGYTDSETGWGYTLLYNIAGQNWDASKTLGPVGNYYGSLQVHNTYEEYIDEYNLWLENRDTWMYDELNKGNEWIQMPDNSGAGTVEYYYKPHVADTLTIFPGTSELSTTILFVFSEGLSSAKLEGEAVGIDGSGVHIDKSKIKPDTLYTLEVTGGDNKVAKVLFKYERTIDATNIAYEKNIISSGTAADGKATNVIVDEFDYSNWQAASINDSWFVVDLGAQYEIEEIEILFGAPYADSFEIQLSKNNRDWINARTVRAFNGSQPILEDGQIMWSSSNTLAMNNPNYGCLGKARYIKFKANTTIKNNSGVSVYEFVVRGTRLYGYNSNLAVVESTAVTASDGSDVEFAVDGNINTGWSSETDFTNSYIMLNLGTPQIIHTIDLMFDSAYASSYRIQISNDGVAWSDAKTINNWMEPGSEDVINDNEAYYSDKIFSYSLHMAGIEATYVRIYVDMSVMSSGMIEVKEIEVWGRASNKTEYWKSQNQEDYGIYVIDEAVATRTDANAQIMKDIELVQSNVLIDGDTYEIEYEPNKTIAFFMNPYNHLINFDTETFLASSASDVYAYGAEFNPAILTYVEKIDATVEYIMPESVDFGSSDYVTTEIAFQVWTTTDLDNDLKTPLEGKKAIRDIKLTIKLLKNHSVDIVDTIEQNGQIKIENPVAGVTYIWQRSQDGINWENVNEKRYDLDIITESGKYLNVAMDLGGGYYYRAKVSGTEEWSHPYKVSYYNNVRNGDFEAPAMVTRAENNSPFNSNADEQQFPNGYPEIMWKTTAPGWYNSGNGVNVGQDIEIVNGRYLKENAGGYWGFSVQLDEMYGDSVHGDQFAELNCENAGALYQDILTTPGSECYWELDQAGRQQQNTMYVVAMSTTRARNHVAETEINKIVELARNFDMANTGAADFIDAKAITLQNGDVAYVWKVEGDPQAGIWTHHTGRYLVPAGTENYLTRFFFVSDATTCIRNDPTIGNFLDNVSFEMKQSYTIEYYIAGKNNNEPVYTVNGMSVPYDRINIPSSIPEYDLTEYTYTGSQIGGTAQDSVFKSYYLDETMKYTIAYEHNVLKLYFESDVIAITKKINGMSSIPEDYRFTFDVMNEAGTEIYYTTTVDGSDFTAIDKININEPDSCFVTMSFKLSDTTNMQAFVEGAKFTVKETVSSLTIEQAEGVDKHLYSVDANGKLTYVDYSEMEDTYSGSFTYSGANDAITFVNNYEEVNRIVITNNVTGNMGDISKMFGFNLNVVQNGKTVAVHTIGANAVQAEDGTYNFSLAHKNTIEFFVYTGCEAVITENDYSNEYYTTTWELKEPAGTTKVDKEHTTSVTTATINGTVTVISTNDNNDLGDVEVQGFQMNTDTSKGAVSEFNPSFRVVYRVAKNTIKRNKVVAKGLIYGLADEFEEGAVLENIMVLDDATLSNDRFGEGTDLVTDKSAYGKFDEEKYTGIIYSHITNEEVGIYPNWTSTDEYSTDVWSYYALTIKGLNYIYEALEQDITFRAYAIVEYKDANGATQRKIEYGKNIYTINMYEIAQDLYDNQKVTSKIGHEFLYNNVLNVVNVHRNKNSITNALYYGLGANGDALSTCNSIIWDMQDYVYCEREYANTYPRTGDFAPKRVNEADIISTLEATVGHAADAKDKCSTLSEWIRDHAEEVRDGKYAGKAFYNKIEYSWDDGIFKGFGKD